MPGGTAGVPELADGSRLDDVTLVLSGRGPTQTVWLVVDGADRFVEQGEVTDLFDPPKRKVA